MIPAHHGALVDDLDMGRAVADGQHVAVIWLGKGQIITAAAALALDDPGIPEVRRQGAVFYQFFEKGGRPHVPQPHNGKLQGVIAFGAFTHHDLHERMIDIAVILDPAVVGDSFRSFQRVFAGEGDAHALITLVQAEDGREPAVHALRDDQFFRLQLIVPPVSAQGQDDGFPVIPAFEGHGIGADLNARLFALFQQAAQKLFFIKLERRGTQVFIFKGDPVTLRGIHVVMEDRDQFSPVRNLKPVLCEDQFPVSGLQRFPFVSLVQHELGGTGPVDRRDIPLHIDDGYVQAFLRGGIPCQESGGTRAHDQKIFHHGRALILSLPPRWPGQGRLFRSFRSPHRQRGLHRNNRLPPGKSPPPGRTSRRCRSRHIHQR